MPIYEFECYGCGHRFSDLYSIEADLSAVACPTCGSRDTGKLVSRPAKARSEEARLDELTDRVEQMGEPESYREMRSVIREAGSAMEEDLGDEMEELLEEDG